MQENIICMKNHISRSPGQRIIRALIFIIVCMALPVHAWAEEDKGYPLASWNKKTGELFLFYYPPGTMFVRPQGRDDVWYDVRDKYSESDLPVWSGDLLKTVVIDSSFADYRPTSTAYWFYNCPSLTSIEGLENINTSEVADMQHMFDGCSSLKELDLGGWDTRKVKNLYKMFIDCSALTTLNVSDFNTSSVWCMAYMFENCSSLETIDVSCFDTSNVTHMNNMFHDCSSLKNIDVSGFNTEKAIYMEYLFCECTKLQELNLASFSTSKVEFMYSMFFDCQSLTKIIVSRERWNTENVTKHSSMFYGCTYLVGEKGTKYNSKHTDKSYAHIDGGPSNPGYLTEDTNGQFEDNSGQTRAYCVLNNGVLTFYYDNKVNSRQGLKFPVERNDGALTMPQWYYKRSGVKKAVFDPSFAAFRPTCTARWFYSFPNLVSIEGLNNLNTSQVTTMAEMFRFSYSLLSLDVSSFDTSQVTDMGCMFCLCTSLAHIDVSNFDTSKVKSMLHMFHACPLTTLDLRSFDTSNVTDMYWMFIDSSVKTIYASEKWSTASVKSSREMFKGCQNLVGGMGTKYDSKHIDHEYAQIDGGLCDPGYLTGEYNGTREPYAVLKDSTLTFYYDWNKNCREGMVYPMGDKGERKWDTDCGYSTNTVSFDSSFADFRPKTTRNWFGGFYYLKVIEDIKNLNTSEVTDMGDMFQFCHSLTKLDLRTFDTGKVINMFAMFHECTKLKSVNVSSFNTSNVTSMGRLFCDCEVLSSIDISNFNTKQVKNMWLMFGRCYELQSLDLTNFNTSSVTNMGAMFYGCNSLTHLNISSFNTENVTDMEVLFYDCKLLNEIDVSSFNTKSLLSTRSMFQGCQSLKNLDLTSFNTANVTSMQNMMYYCTSLESVDLSSFNTANVTYMPEMFYLCKKLRTVYVGDGWNMKNIQDSSRAFDDCVSLVGGMGTVYDPNHSDHTYAHIDGGPSNPGYFTYKEYDETKGVEDVRVTGRMENEAMYNLQGIRLKEPIKGLYIKNGKKYLKR